MNLRLANAVENYLEKIEALYYHAFPEEERKPFAMLLEKEKQNNVEILAVTTVDGEFLGEAITAMYEDMVLLDYFAMAPECRGKGNGSLVLKGLQERYGEKRFFLEIERTGVPAPNAEQRIRRKKFYLSNDMKLTECYVEVRGVEMEILTHDCSIEFEEYCSLYKNIYGKEIGNQIKRK